MIIESMGGCDQSQVKIKFKKFKKVKSIPKDIPKSHNDDTDDILLPLGERLLLEMVEWKREAK